MRTKAQKQWEHRESRGWACLGEKKGGNSEGGLAGHSKDCGLYPKSSRKPQKHWKGEGYGWLCDFRSLLCVRCQEWKGVDQRGFWEAR